MLITVNSQAQLVLVLVDTSSPSRMKVVFNIHQCCVVNSSCSRMCKHTRCHTLLTVLVNVSHLYNKGIKYKNTMI